MRIFIAACILWMVAFVHPAFGAGVDGELRTFIKDFYKGEEVSVSFSHIPPHLKGNVTVKGINFTKVPDSQGNGICLVTTGGKNGSETKSQVSFRVLVKKMLYMAASSITKGEVIRRDDITGKETYLNGAAANYPARVEDVVGKIARKDIPSGEVLTKQLLEEPIVIHRGELVHIKAQNARIVVETKGVALEKGRIGDVVRAKAVSGKEIVGKVMAGNTIIVEF